MKKVILLSVLILILLASYISYRISKSKTECPLNCNLQFDSDICKEGQIGCAYDACIAQCDLTCIHIPLVKDVVCF